MIASPSACEGESPFWSRVRIAPLEGLASYLYSYSAVITITNMKLIVKNRAGAKVLPDGLEVKDVRFEIGPTTLQFEIHVTGYFLTSLRHSVDTNAL